VQQPPDESGREPDEPEPAGPAGTEPATPAAPESTRRERLVELARFVPDCARLFKRLLLDDRVPLFSKLVLAGAVVYLLMPFDLVPDFIPWLGQLDDVAVVAVAIAWVARSAGREVIAELWPGTDAGLRAVLVLAP
jgi:uncharacterized membrane protein YkvA (DUF1232 family)